MDLDRYSAGFQILREYIYFNHLDLLKSCKKYDKSDKGALSLDLFKQMLMSTRLNFPRESIYEILESVPKNDRGEINYRDLYFIVKRGAPPKTKLTLKLLYVGDAAMKEEGHGESVYDYTADNFFDTKEDFEFENYELNKLVIKYLMSKKGGIDLTAKKAVGTEKLASIISMNNSIYLENFETQMADKMISALQGKLPAPISEDEISMRLQAEFPEWQDLNAPLIVEDFNRLLVKMKVDLLQDERHLLYYLISKSVHHGNLMPKSTIPKWVYLKQKRELKEPIDLSIYDVDFDARKQAREKIPKIMESLLKVSHDLGYDWVVNLINSASRDHKLTVTELKFILEEFEVPYKLDHLNEFLTFLIDRRVMESKTNAEKSLISGYQVLLDKTKLKDLLRKELSKIGYVFRDQPEDTPKQQQPVEPEPEFKDSMVKVIYLILEKNYVELSTRLKLFADQNNLIPEMKLRQVFFELFPGLDFTILDQMIVSLKFSVQPTATSFQRRIEVNEFLSRLKDEINEMKKGETQPFVQERDPTKEKKREDGKTKSKKDEADRLPDGTVIPPLPELGAKSTPKLSAPIEEEGYNTFTNQPFRRVQTVADFNFEKTMNKLWKVLKFHFDHRPPGKEEEFLTAPLLTLMKYYDKTASGVLELDHVLEIFRIFSNNTFDDSDLLALKMMMNEDAKVKTIPDAKMRPNQTNPVSYFFFLVTLEKYFGSWKRNISK